MTKFEKILKEKGISQAELARKLSASRQQVGIWVLGIGKPNLKNAKRIADVLGMSIEEVFFGNDGKGE